MKTMPRIILFLIIVVCLNGCTAGVDKQKISKSFDGISSLYDCNDTFPEAECVKSVSIIHIHGMGVHYSMSSPHKSRANIQLRDKLVKSLGFDVVDDKDEEASDWLYIDQILAGRWSSSTYSDPKRTLNYLEINWDELTRKIQHSMLDLQVPLDKFHDKKARLKENYPNVAYANKHIKDILDVGFSDAVIYVGGLRKTLQDIVIQGLTEIMKVQGKSWNRRSQDNHKVVIIADSLGSTLTFDTLMRLKSNPENSDLYRLFNAKIRQLYLNANQLPLLEMARLERKDLEEIFGQESAAIIGRPCDREGAVSRLSFVDEESQLQVVSFTDNNDALSYKITDKFLIDYLCLPTVERGTKINESQIKWIEVSVTNGSTIPFLFVNPTTAHTSGFKKNNNEAIKLMVNGFNVDN